MAWETAKRNVQRFWVFLGFRHCLYLLVYNIGTFSNICWPKLLILKILDIILDHK